MGIKAKNVVIWLVLLLIGLSMIVGPVVARNAWSLSPKIKNMSTGIPIAAKITNEDKDKNVKGLDIDKKDKKDNNDNSIKIKSHPVLKSPT
jgi:hypothetical protein